MGGNEVPKEEPLGLLLATASEIFQKLPSVLARGRDLESTLLTEDVNWYIDNSLRCMAMMLMLAENGVNPCPSVAAHILDASLGPRES